MIVAGRIYATFQPCFHSLERTQLSCFLLSHSIDNQHKRNLVYLPTVQERTNIMVTVFLVLVCVGFQGVWSAPCSQAKLMSCVGMMNLEGVTGFDPKLCEGLKCFQDASTGCDVPEEMKPMTASLKNYEALCQEGDCSMQRFQQCAAPISSMQNLSLSQDPEALSKFCSTVSPSMECLKQMMSCENLKEVMGKMPESMKLLESMCGGSASSANSGECSMAKFQECAAPMMKNMQNNNLEFDVQDAEALSKICSAMGPSVKCLVPMLPCENLKTFMEPMSSSLKMLSSICGDSGSGSSSSGSSSNTAICDPSSCMGLMSGVAEDPKKLCSTMKSVVECLKDKKNKCPSEALKDTIQTAIDQVDNSECCESLVIIDRDCKPQVSEVLFVNTTEENCMELQKQIACVNANTIKCEGSPAFSPGIKIAKQQLTAKAEKCTNSGYKVDPNAKQNNSGSMLQSTAVMLMVSVLAGVLHLLT